MYKYELTAKVIDINLEEEWDAEDTVVAEDEVDAWNIFIDGIKNYYGSDVDVVDIEVKELGPADVFIHSSKETFRPETPTITVGELIDYLEENFDRNSKIYLARYSWPGYQYSGIDTLKIGYDAKD